MDDIGIEQTPGKYCLQQHVANLLFSLFAKAQAAVLNQFFVAYASPLLAQGIKKPASACRGVQKTVTSRQIGASSCWWRNSWSTWIYKSACKQWEKPATGGNTSNHKSSP